MCRQSRESGKSVLKRKKKKLRRKGFVEKEGFKPGVKE